jgi:predicted acetyltransferase
VGRSESCIYGERVEIRDLDLRHLDAALDIRTRSFGPLDDTRKERWRQLILRSVPDRLVLGCHDGPRLVAMARINAFRQWWHGRALPMAGIGGVVVAPEYRGRGVARQLMVAILERSAELGYPISALYPATVPLYRSLGWEVAGSQHLVTVPSEALRELAATPVPVRRVGPDDVPKILSVVRRIHTNARSSGPIEWDESDVRLWLTDEEPYCYLAEDGFLAYQWDGSDLDVEELVAGSEATARTLWSLVGSGSSIARTVKACVAPYDPLFWLTREVAVQPAEQKRWMFRLVDVPAALTGRGYPAGVDVEVSFTVDDRERPGNSATWQLNVSKGVGRVEPVTGRPATLHLGPRGLAALYAGTPLSTLRATGLASGGDPEADALLDTAFGGTPYMVDYF